MKNIEQKDKPDFFESIVQKFPSEYRQAANRLNTEEMNRLEEIRIKAGEKIIFAGGFGEIDSGVTVSFKGLSLIVERILDYSVYAHMEALCKGFVTVEGGHRIGICGKAVMDKGVIKTIKEVSSINIRRSKEVQGCSKKLCQYVFDSKGKFINTMIISPPNCGKTTLLRDLVREISDRGIRVSLVDERSEIAAVYKGIPQHNIGLRCDVLDGCRKSEGIVMMLRAMAPEVICTDEIGNSEDAAAINEAVTSGIGVLTTVHGSDINGLKLSKIGQLIEEKVFKRFVFLSSVPRVGTINKILDEDGIELMPERRV